MVPLHGFEVLVEPLYDFFEIPLSGFLSFEREVSPRVCKPDRSWHLVKILECRRDALQLC